MKNVAPEKEDAWADPGIVTSEALDHAQEPEELLTLLKQFGFAQEDIAQGTGTDERTVRRWKSKSPGRTAAARLAEIRNIVLVLREERILTDRGIVYWMRHANRQLEDYSPLAMVAAGGFRAALEAAKCFSDSERGFEEEIPAEVLQRLRKPKARQSSNHRSAKSKKLEPV